MADWVGESRAAGRARWLAELAEAVDRAQLALWALAETEQTSAKGRELYGQLESVRVEIEALRGAGNAGANQVHIGEWLELLARSARTTRTAPRGWARRPAADRRRPRIR